MGAFGIVAEIMLLFFPYKDKKADGDKDEEDELNEKNAARGHDGHHQGDP